MNRLSYAGRCLRAALDRQENNDKIRHPSIQEPVPIQPKETSLENSNNWFDQTFPPLQPTYSFVPNDTSSDNSNILESTENASYTDLSNIEGMEIQTFQNSVIFSTLTTEESSGGDRINNNPSVPAITQDSDDDDVLSTIPVGTENIEPTENVTVGSEDKSEGTVSRDVLVERARPLKRGKDSWKRNVSKRMRMLGEEYQGRVYDKEKGEVAEITKKSRDLGPRCGGKRCDLKPGGAIQCYRFTEDCRKSIFNTFWSQADWNQRKVYVSSLIEQIDFQNNNPKSCKTKSVQYHLFLDNQKVRVCSKMFSNTLAISDRTILSWIGKSTNGLVPSTMYSPPQKKCQGRSQDNVERRNAAQEFIDKLPKVPSHYCRSTSMRSYLWPYDFKGVTDVHRAYVEWAGETHVSLTVFSDLLKANNISIWQPRKDQCDMCVGFAQGNISLEDYTRHRASKDQARGAKEEDIERASQSSGKLVVLTVDVQAVQGVPATNASCLYFKTKLNLHNYTVYNECSKEVMCYVWPETSGGLSASIFTTCLINFLNTIKTDVLEEIAIWSDGCGAQNRNAVLVSALSQWAQDSAIIVNLKYLEKGHTQMSVDSVHSKIEQRKKKNDLQVPADYCRIIKEARRNPSPFQYKYLDCSFFMDYEKTAVLSSIRPGTSRGDACVFDLRQLKMSTDGSIQFKLDHGEGELHDLPQRKRRPITNSLEALYSQPLPISSSKFKDLQDMKKILHPDHHAFYDSLPHN